MALQSSGPISLNDIATEFGGSTPHSLSEYYDAASGIPASGAISFSQFYGKSSIITSTITYTGGTAPYNGTAAAMFSSSGMSLQTPGDLARYFDFTITPGIPVTSGVKMMLERGGDGKVTSMVINNGLPDQFQTTTNSAGNPTTFNYSGTWVNFRIICDTDDEGGDNYSARVLEINGGPNWTYVNSTTITIP